MLATVVLIPAGVILLAAVVTLIARHREQRQRSEDAGASLPRGMKASTKLAVGWAAAALLGVVGGPLLAFLPWLREMNQELVCGPGGRILVTSTSGFDESTHYGLYCAGDIDRSLALHYASGGLVAAACVLTLVVGSTLPSLVGRARTPDF
jgi:hypothetical protein